MFLLGYCGVSGCGKIRVHAKGVGCYPLGATVLYRIWRKQEVIAEGYLMPCSVSA